MGEWRAANLSPPCHHPSFLPSLPPFSPPPSLHPEAHIPLWFCFNGSKCSSTALQNTTDEHSAHPGNLCGVLCNAINPTHIHRDRQTERPTDGQRDGSESTQQIIAMDMEMGFPKWGSGEQGAGEMRAGSVEASL
ncbi:unnamed protein product [Pleuronectes platessa]|uniref:Uncharacterized protein n=1 Tax=Pleuronectes platessa TaxID=8262 RepID=A0A9N7UEP3_PLEPL|nr:unnamed protein product [Pleuronectes platessa]